MSNKRITTAEIVDDLKTCSDMDNASCLFCWRYSSGTRDAHCVGTLMIDAAERLESLQNAMNRLGKFGKLFMDYEGCPRGPMGRMAGVSLVDEALSMPEIVDVDGGRWIPVQADVLYELCEQLRFGKSTPERHGHWVWFHEIVKDMHGLRAIDGCTCNLCGIGSSGHEYCEHCGAKMDEEGNDGSVY